MADFNFKRESCEGMRDYNVEETIFENQASETRLISSGKLIGFKIKSPALTYAQLQEYINFFDSKFGSLISFTILYPFDNTEYTVRFEKGSWREFYELGFFRVEFSLKRVF